MTLPLESISTHPHTTLRSDTPLGRMASTHRVQKHRSSKTRRSSLYVTRTEQALRHLDELARIVQEDEPDLTEVRRLVAAARAEANTTITKRTIRRTSEIANTIANDLAKKTFDIAEVLEHILSFLSTPSLLRAQQVSRDFNDCVRGYSLFNARLASRQTLQATSVFLSSKYTRHG